MSYIHDFEKTVCLANRGFTVHCELGFYHDHGGEISVERFPQDQRIEGIFRSVDTSEWDAEKSLKDVMLPYKSRTGRLFRNKIVILEPEFFSTALDIWTAVGIIDRSQRELFSDIEKTIGQLLDQRKIVSTDISRAAKDALKFVVEDFVSTIVSSGNPPEKVVTMIRLCCADIRGSHPSESEEKLCSGLSEYFRRYLGADTEEVVIKALVAITRLYTGHLGIESSLFSRLGIGCPSLETQRSIVRKLFAEKFLEAFPTHDPFKTFTLLFDINSLSPFKDFDFWMDAKRDNHEATRARFFELVKETCEEMHVELSTIVEKMSDLQKEVICSLTLQKL